MHRHVHGFGHRDPFHEVRRFGPLRSPSRSGAGTIAVFGTIALLAIWAGVATLFILFRDDALKLIAERQIAITRAHDAEVIRLQAEIDRLRSLKLIEQERVDRTLAELVRRQTVLETRQSAVSALGSPKSSHGARNDLPEITGSLSPVEPPAATNAPKPSPLSDTILISPPPERWARLESRPLPPLGHSIGASVAETANDVRLVNLAHGLEQLERAQSGALNQVEEHYDGLERRMRKVFADLGLDPSQRSFRLAANSGGELASGGPFLPWTRPPEDPFARQILRVRGTAVAVETLQRKLRTVPVHRPTLGETDVTSPFGMRVDPFLGQLALHTGIDFRGEPGDPVRAAADGKVVRAERNGGYGLMVEIDHGSGITTRYAHLSSLLVGEGVRVKAGEQIGRVGSTGRATGPHLHYEVRLDGEPVDPQKFLRAGLRLEARP